MSRRIQNPQVRTQNGATIWFALLALLTSACVALAEDLTSLRADRAAVERIYYNHRLGEKPPFEQTLPPATLDNLVRQDLRKEAALKKTYGIVITPAQLETEVRRINTTTRAPEMLAEIKAALGGDPERFANGFAKPILVERLLREKFDNDDSLHASQRGQVESTRNELLAAKTNGASWETLLAFLQRGHSNSVTETTWLLAARPFETNAPTGGEMEIKKRFGANAQILSSPQAGEGKERKFYFEELPGELQNLLRVQLRQPGDLSVLIEMPGGFMLYLMKAKTVTGLSVAALSLPKRSYEQWLDEQSEHEP